MKAWYLSFFILLFVFGCSSEESANRLTSANAFGDDACTQSGIDCPLVIRSEPLSGSTIFYNRTSSGGGVITFRFNKKLTSDDLTFELSLDQVPGSTTFEWHADEYGVDLVAPTQGWVVGQGIPVTVKSIGSGENFYFAFNIVNSVAPPTTTPIGL